MANSAPSLSAVLSFSLVAALATLAVSCGSDDEHRGALMESGYTHLYQIQPGTRMRLNRDAVIESQTLFFQDGKQIGFSISDVDHKKNYCALLAEYRRKTYVVHAGEIMSVMKITINGFNTATVSQGENNLSFEPKAVSPADQIVAFNCFSPRTLLMSLAEIDAVTGGLFSVVE